jgi:Tol biopolymer transport system component
MQVRLFLLVAGALATSQPALLPQTATDIHLFPMAGGVGSLARAKPRPLATERGYENQPFFDPDGRRVLYTANRDGRQTDVYEFDRTTGATRQLTRTSEGEYSPTIPAVKPAATALAREGFTVIRVESDGTQRLWQFDREGRSPSLVLEHIKPVGYHAWIDADRLALYVLGQPATLQLARVSTGRAETVASDIGRTLRVIPGSSRVSFVQREGENAYSIMALDPATGRAESLTGTVEGSSDRDYAWMPGGETLLMSAGTKVFAWTRGEQGWREVLDVGPHGLGAVTRLAVSPDADALAVVTAESDGRSAELQLRRTVAAP